MTRDEFRQEFYPVFYRLVAVTFVVCGALFFCRDIVVAVMLSASYAPAADYMPIQLLGDLFRSGGWCFGMVLIARRETKIFLIVELGANLLFAIGSFIGIRLFEMHGPMMAYALENFVTLIALVIAVRRLKWNTP
jgi:PST family polysaccharide transporter